MNRRFDVYMDGTVKEWRRVESDIHVHPECYKANWMEIFADSVVQFLKVAEAYAIKYIQKGT